MLPYNFKVAERRKARKEKPRQHAQRAAKLHQERMRKRGIKQ